MIVVAGELDVGVDDAVAGEPASSSSEQAVTTATTSNRAAIAHRDRLGAGRMRPV
jgi:hypothetical protein